MNFSTTTPLLRARLQLKRQSFCLNANLELPARGVSVLFGASGSGKTTCLRLIAGLDNNPGNQIHLGDTAWQDDSSGVFVPVHRRHIGYVFQEANLFPHLSVSQNLAYGQTRRGNPKINFLHLLSLLGISHLLDRSPMGLSGGERQRVSIARALLSSPRILLMDEPLASLDNARKEEILPYIEHLRDQLEIPIIYVTHSGAEMARLADYIVLMDTGSVVASGPAVHMLADPRLSAKFGQEGGSIIEGQVTGFDPNFGLLKLRFSGGELSLVHSELKTGTPLRVRIRPSDVSIACNNTSESSILNIIRCQIVDVVNDQNKPHVEIALRAGKSRFLARITRLSYERLNLKPDLDVWAQIKSVAIVG